MTESLERIESRLHSATEIHGIFGAMRAMAAARLQQAQAALTGTRAYADTVGAAAAEVLALAPLPPQRVAAGRPLLVAFMPEHGFVGGLVERLVERVRERAGVAALIVVGDRGADVVEERGIAMHARLALGAHPAAAPPTARRIGAAIGGLYAGQQVDATEVLFARYARAGSADLIERRLLPIDPASLPPAGGQPLVNLPVAALAEAALSEWVLGELVHAAVETLASENGARLLAMEAARSSVESKIEELRRDYRAVRQETITAEIAEVVSGVLAQEQA